MNLFALTVHIQEKPGRNKNIICKGNIGTTRSTYIIHTTAGDGLAWLFFILTTTVHV